MVQKAMQISETRHNTDDDRPSLSTSPEAPAQENEVKTKKMLPRRQPGAHSLLAAQASPFLPSVDWKLQ